MNARDPRRPLGPKGPTAPPTKPVIRRPPPFPPIPPKTYTSVEEMRADPDYWAAVRADVATWPDFTPEQRDALATAFRRHRNRAA